MSVLYIVLTSSSTQFSAVNTKVTIQSFGSFLLIPSPPPTDLTPLPLPPPPTHTHPPPTHTHTHTHHNGYVK